MSKKIFLVFIAFSLPIFCYSIEPRFNHLTNANGLSHSEVNAILEDKNGFLWIGTVHGLNRYDGYSFEIFNTDKNKSNSLSNNTVKSLVEDEMGRIWIGTDNGLNFYDQRNELIYPVNLSTSKEKLSILNLTIYNNYLIAGTNDGLWVVNLKNLSQVENGKFAVFFENYYNELIVRGVTPSLKGGVLFMIDDSILRVYFDNGQTKPIIKQEYPLKDKKWRSKLVEDTTGSFWIISNEIGIIRYNTKNMSIRNITLENNILREYTKKYIALSIDKKQKLWVGTSDKGLICISYDYEKEEVISIEKIPANQGSLSDLNSNHISLTYISEKDNLWIGTIGSGANYLDKGQKKFQYYRIKSENTDNSNYIRAVLVDKQNRIIAGTTNNGLYIFDRKTHQSKKLGFDSETVFHIAEYADDVYFICSTKGVSLVEIKDSQCRILSNSGNKKSASFYITQCNKDLFWCATYTGLLRIRVQDNKLLSDLEINNSGNPALSGNICRVLYFDKSTNQLIVGTHGGGLNYIQLDKNYNPVGIQVYNMSKSQNSISSDYIRSVVKDKNNTYWIGTYEGLNKVIYNKKTGERTFQSFTKDDGLPNNLISSIFVDDNNNLWLGTNAGISKFSIQNETFVNYNIDDGLQNNEFSEHAVYQSKDGEVFLGGITGINSFYPEEIKISNLKPRTLITDFYINNERIMSDQEVAGYVPLENSILYTNNVKLESSHKNIGFKFSAMVYPNAGKVKYAYMLEGFDEKWKYTDALNRVVHYTNLPHGKYIFKVKSTNADGIWNENPTSVFIHIKTPYYLSWVAFVVYILLFVFLFIYFSHYTVINLTTKRNLLLDKEHNEKIINLDKMRTRFFINISHDLRTPLTLISGPLNDIMTDKNLSGKLLDNLQLIKRNVKRLTDQVEQLLDFRKAEQSSMKSRLQTIDFVEFSNNELSYFSYLAAKKGLVLSLECNEPQLIISVDPGMISKVYLNIISNALKYTNSGSITINIRRIEKELPQLFNTSNNQFIQVEIIDTGIGISKEQEKHIFDRFYQGNQQDAGGYGIGLSHAKDLIEAHKGLIEAEINPTGGTIVRFFIPSVVESTISATSVYNDNVIAQSEDTGTNNETENLINPEFKTVLIIEDSIDILVYLKNCLKNTYNVFVAKNGLEGLSIAKDKMPDLIISDVMMPEMDGIELCRAIKTHIATSHIPVILLTAKVDAEKKHKGIETGADDYIPKPFDKEYLLIRINNLLESRENLRKLFQRSMVLEPTEVTLTSVDEVFLKKLMVLVEERISDESFSINSLESTLGVSHSTLYRKIKSLTGQSAHEFILNVRLKRAHQLLSGKKGLRVSEVAYMVGFSNPRYFTKCFKSLFGYIPTQVNDSNDISRTTTLLHLVFFSISGYLY